VGQIVWSEDKRVAPCYPSAPHQFTCEGCGDVHTHLYPTTPSGKIFGHIARFCPPCKKRRDRDRHDAKPRIIVWTDERKEVAARLWREGQTCRQIAAVIGGVTRNAVIGIINRLGLSGLQPKQQKKSPEHRRIKNAEKRQRYRSKTRFTRSSPALPPRVNKTAWVSVIAPPDAPPSLNLSIIAVKPNQCRHIAGDDHLCCGNPIVEGTSWCGFHYGTVFWRP
jgi:hypothetical protein